MQAADSSSQGITWLLSRVEAGDNAAREDLARAVIARLQQIATHELAALNAGGLHGLTHEPAMFANDALLKLLAQPQNFENRRHFFAYATQVMVRAMIDYQRARHAQKRGGDLQRVSLSGLDQCMSVDVEDASEVLAELEQLDPRKADLIRLRVFLGFSAEEAANALQISLSTVERDWRFLRHWMSARMAAQRAD
ncbi:MAG: sigma-70 family RNA polymerase sigma factor [Aquimonas sp.]|nr:sigma-70 family RNA polymerase sigma factor [Aquimonas sp.]